MILMCVMEECGKSIQRRLADSNFLRRYFVRVVWTLAANPIRCYCTKNCSS